MENRHFLGLWTIKISEDRTDISIVPERVSDLHLNVVKLLEGKACTNCLQISNVLELPENTLSVDVTLKHPYPSLKKYTAFDVRGVIITGSDYSFPESDRSISWDGTNIRLLNPDGYTDLFNPTEYPVNSSGFPALRYIPGNLAPGGDLSATLNPFTCFYTHDERRMFEAGGIDTRTMELKVPAGPLEFGYAVDVCWFPIESPIDDPITDFPLSANSLEAYTINCIVENELAPESWGYMPVSVEVFDHQGLNTISSVRIEAPEIFNGEILVEFVEMNAEGGALFECTIQNELAAQQDVYPMLVQVVDVENDPNLGEIAAWQIIPVRVTAGWARWWGSSGTDVLLAKDNNGNILVTGYLTYPSDLAPGPDEYIHVPDGLSDVFLSKFASNGEFLWVKAWGGPDSDFSHSVTCDSIGNIYTVGSFGGTCDFDPGPGMNERSSNGDADVFLSKLSSQGELVWVYTFGGVASDNACAVHVDTSDNLYVAGTFRQTVDFDPGPGLEERTSNGLKDVFLCCVSADGEFQWVRTWGGSSFDEPTKLEIWDETRILITGDFNGTCDFDPGPGLEERSPIGLQDCFLSVFNIAGDFQRVLVWGGAGHDIVSGVAADETGNIVVTGRFQTTVDFDPGPALNEISPISAEDAYVSRFNSAGEHVWVRSWPTNDSYWEIGEDCAIDGDGKIFVAGRFKDTVDFDPGSGSDLKISNGWADAYLTVFDSSGVFEWVRNWGGESYDQSTYVGIGGSRNLYVTGSFTGMIDFDPGEGVDIRGGPSRQTFLTMFPHDGNW